LSQPYLDMRHQTHPLTAYLNRAPLVHIAPNKAYGRPYHLSLWKIPAPDIWPPAKS